MQEGIYLKDCYLKEFDAVVKSVKDGKYIILNQTAFYPVSGGQPHDTGKIICNEVDYNVVFVGKFDGNISHEVDKEGLKEGDKVHCVIDWNKRYKLMRMHTATHILCAIANQTGNVLITGSQLGEDKTRVDLSLESMDKEIINGLIGKTNEEISKNLDIKISFLPREEAEKLSKLAEADYQDLKELRMINIDGIDFQPCGGTHVKNSSEIKGIELVSLENKGKGRKRIYFKLKD